MSRGAPDDPGRRAFLRGAAAAGGALLAGKALDRPAHARALDTTHSPERLGVLVDLTRCIGCRRCEGACNAANGLPAPEISFDDKTVFETERRTDPQTYTVVNRFASADPLGQPVYAKFQCMHCEEPACAAACPVAALQKTPHGPVVYDKDLCIGCRYCMIACPFYVPTFEYANAFDPKIQKCYMCNHRLSKGELPGCVAECPVEALKFGTRHGLLDLARERIRHHPDRYVDHVYGEHEAGGTSWLYISGVPFEQVNLPTDVGNRPYLEYTQSFLSLVPIVLVGWPALLGSFYFLSGRDRSGAPRASPSTRAGSDQT